MGQEDPTSRLDRLSGSDAPLKPDFDAETVYFGFDHENSNPNNDTMPKSWKKRSFREAFFDVLGDCVDTRLSTKIAAFDEDDDDFSENMSFFLENWFRVYAEELPEPMSSFLLGVFDEVVWESVVLSAFKRSGAPYNIENDAGEYVMNHWMNTLLEGSGSETYLFRWFRRWSSSVLEPRIERGNVSIEEGTRMFSSALGTLLKSRAIDAVRSYNVRPSSSSEDSFEFVDPSSEDSSVTADLRISLEESELSQVPGEHSLFEYISLRQEGNTVEDLANGWGVSPAKLLRSVESAMRKALLTGTDIEFDEQDEKSSDFYRVRSVDKMIEDFRVSSAKRKIAEYMSVIEETVQGYLDNDTDPVAETTE